MDLSLRGSFHLFRLAGISVYLHWSWFLVAFLQISSRADVYQGQGWKVVEYLALFGIVLLHEFGHALACRSVGGIAERIVLWPLGGVAYVAPPPRPGPILWSIAAGPLVNVALVLPFFGLNLLADANDWANTRPDAALFVTNLARLNLVLLIFNVLPIYPLDGGQILHALLWFPLGRWTSLLVVSLIGMVLGGGLVLFSVVLFVLSRGEPGAIFFGLISAFIVLRSLVSFQHARAVRQLEALPRHENAACPTCGIAPPRGPYWVCEHCQTRFDLFDHRGHCPACGAWYLHPACPHCHQAGHIDTWLPGAQRAAPSVGEDGGSGQSFPTRPHV
jgi:Zn-dependent protease